MKSLVIFSLLISTSAFAHSGRTDASGCHHNHSTGDYHCHGGNKAKSKGRDPASVDVKKKQKSPHVQAKKVSR